ncbi:MAG: hypothetical protein P1S46_11060 [bacterium]|nr:hypothetical protein [bacterium]
MNKAVIRMLEKAIGRSGSSGKPPIHEELDRFSGAWSPEEAAEIEGSLSGTRTVDEELWS